MKTNKSLFIIFLSICSFLACTREEEEIETGFAAAETTSLTKAIESVHETPYFDWEDTSYELLLYEKDN